MLTSFCTIDVLEFTVDHMKSCLRLHKSCLITFHFFTFSIIISSSKS